MENNIKVSVIMPVYNTGEYLKTAVGSILSQSLKEFELILVDDGSTDGSSERCDEYARQDSRVVVLHQKNGGICNARNAALKIAKGEYIAFSDHDDEYLPGLLEHAYARAKRDMADIVKFCKKEIISKNGILIRTRKTQMTDRVYRGSEIREAYLELLGAKVIDCVWDGLFRRAFLNANDIRFNEKYRVGGEDIDIVSRMFIKAEVLSTMSECYYMHYIRQGFSTSAKFSPYKLETCRMLAETITRSAQEMGLNIEHHKAQYAYQMTYTLFNNWASILMNPNCQSTMNERVVKLESLRHISFFPQWIYSVNSLCVARIEIRYGLAFYLYKHCLYRFLLWMNGWRMNLLDRRTRNSYKGNYR